MGLNDIQAQIDEIEATLETEDSEALRAELDRLEGERTEKLLRVAAWRRRLQDEVKGVIDEEVDRLRERKKTYNRKIDGLGEYLTFHAKHGKVNGPLGSLWAVSKPVVVVCDLALVPAPFMREIESQEGLGSYVFDLQQGQYRFEVDGFTVSIQKPDKVKILEHYKTTGEILPGVQIETREYAQFR